MKINRIIIILIGCLGWGHLAMAQPMTKPVKDSTKIQPFSRTVEANFLSSYYHQEGDNAAVTGGIGTEQLTDIANIFTVNVPLNGINAVSFYGGADYYTSASTDQIDNNPSSASRQDVRSFGTLSYNRLNLRRGESYTAKLGFSAEYDVTSVSGGLTYTKAWNEQNSELSISGQVFIDQWELYYPQELRRRVSLPTSLRQAYNGSIVFSQILARRAQLSLSAEVIYMRGLLSTPFHRVYFGDRPTLDIERLPNQRLKIPLAVRFNYYLADQFVWRTYYRYYWDDFGIQGHTLELETPIKIAKALTIAPFYRYHTQTGADYFAPYETHISTSEFYSSDYDLAALQSHKYGLGIKYFPLYGLARSRPFFKSRRIAMLKYVELRGATYRRSTGLRAVVGSLNVGFSLE